MKRKTIHIGVFLSLLAGITFLAHEIIPHRHHFESLQICQQHHQENQSHQVHDNTSAEHCHAFNILVAERPGYGHAKSLLFKGFVSLLHTNEYRLKPITERVAVIPFKKIHFSGQTSSAPVSLRGPPSA